MITIDNMEWRYHVVNTTSLFIGLNPRAVSFLIEHGDWSRVLDAENHGYRGEFGMMFVTNDSLKHNLCDLIGCLYGDFIIPTFVHDWYPYSKKDSTENVKFMPLYRYKMDKTKVSDEWLYESLDTKRSSLYKDVRFLCLTDNTGTPLFEWTDDELEIAELMMEYQAGIV